ncbi:MAG TPA: ATP-binding protein [Thermoanaerobaculaceae bacterium]|nr:ATP-binding protein [Thermoanaerobaculaceae bacterium]HPS77421.1 ATP-binding protein [Thermoanaerobaculaceae bacterium]
MQGYLPRLAEAEVERRLSNAPAVAVLGPRQCGKSTLAGQVMLRHPGAVLLDLERPSDRARLADPEAFFALHRDTMVCLDEVQRMPELFPVLRSVLDERARPGQLLILGSASPELLQQSSESLAGRLAFVELTPFFLPEVDGGKGRDALLSLWLKGGFPRSFLAVDDATSAEWRDDFVRTFLERDIARVAPKVPGQRLDRFWRMCAHVHGQVLNSSRLAGALGVSAHTVRAYLELLERTFMVRLLQPLEANFGKRLVRSPKLLLRDTGILHTLLGITTHDELLGHPTRGASWEGLVIEHVLAAFPRWQASFVRTAGGAEMDLVLERGGRRLGIECKASSAPRPSRGFWNVIEDLGIERAFIVAPIAEGFPLGPRAAALSLGDLLAAASRIDAGEPIPVLS